MLNEVCVACEALRKEMLWNNIQITVGLLIICITMLYVLKRLKKIDIIDENNYTFLNE